VVPHSGPNAITVSFAEPSRWIQRFGKDISSVLARFCSCAVHIASQAVYYAPPPVNRPIRARRRSRPAPPPLRRPRRKRRRFRLCFPCRRDGRAMIAERCAAVTTGPKRPEQDRANLFGVVGRPKASHPVSIIRRLKAKGGDGPMPTFHFLAAARSLRSGTKMSFAGLQRPQDRLNVIAFYGCNDTPRACPPRAPHRRRALRAV